MTLALHLQKSDYRYIAIHSPLFRHTDSNLPTNPAIWAAVLPTEFTWSTFAPASSTCLVTSVFPEANSPKHLTIILQTFLIMFTSNHFYSSSQCLQSKSNTIEIEWLLLKSCIIQFLEDFFVKLYTCRWIIENVWLTFFKLTHFFHFLHCWFEIPDKAANIRVE